MALVFLLMAVSFTSVSTINGEMAVVNITRYATGDLFTITGTDCDTSLCVEVANGTARVSEGLGGDCVCQCQAETPAFREDQRLCTNQIDECRMATFGRGVTQPQIPYAFLPLKGQIIYPSKEIVFTEVSDAACAVTSSQYLTSAGWVTLRDILDNDVPFGLYRDEGSTFLQWRGSAALHARLEGRLVAVHVLCSSTPTHLAASCAAFRVAGAYHNTLLDVRSIPFHAGEPVPAETATQGQGLSVLEALAIGVCVLMLIFIYAAGIVCYIHYKQKQKKSKKDPELNLSDTLSTENESPSNTLNMHMTIDGMRLKNNPLASIEMSNNFLHDVGLSDVSEHTEDNIDSSPNNTYRKRNTNTTSAMIHTRRKKAPRPTTRALSTPERFMERLQRRSQSPDTFEKAPHSELSIVDCSVESNLIHNQPPTPPNGQNIIRKKLYFNPVFFETEHLKNPPPAAIDFLVKIREIMFVAKEKMMSKRFVPILSDIPEEELYHTIDLGWDIPCARRGRRFSAINLKRENSRRAIHCGGCPGCGKLREDKTTALARSNSCTTCESENYRQKIVRKWLDEVHSPNPTSKSMTKSIAKVSGIPRTVENKTNDDGLMINPIEPLRSEETETVTITESIVKEDIDFTQSNCTTILSSNNPRQDDVSSNHITTTTFPNDKIHNNINTRRVEKNLLNQLPSINSGDLPISNEIESIPKEIKLKMEAVIRELHECTRPDVEINRKNLVNNNDKNNPKIVIPVIGADSLSSNHENICFIEQNYQNPFIEFDSLERNTMKKRRYSFDYESESNNKIESKHKPYINLGQNRLSRSWRDVRRINKFESPDFGNNIKAVSEVFVNSTGLYCNLTKSGSLTIEVPGSPVEHQDNISEEFDPDTLDRKPKREAKKRIDKILLKSGGSFKNKLRPVEYDKCENSPPKTVFTRKIGSLRQIYEAKTNNLDEQFNFYGRRGSLPHEELSGVLQPSIFLDNRDGRTKTVSSKIKKQWCNDENSIKKSESIRNNCSGNRQRSSEERDNFPTYSRDGNSNIRNTNSRLVRNRLKRNDFKKPYKTEDSGYLSTDSNESKRKSRYLMQIQSKTEIIPSVTALTRSLSLQIESDTDDLESLCDGRSESGGESIETDSVFFGKFGDTKQILAELSLSSLETNTKTYRSQDQADSGFVGETNILFSGDSDSEHKSVISIVTGNGQRARSVSRSDNSSTKLDSGEV